MLAPTRNTALAIAIAADGRHHYVIAAEARINQNTLSKIKSGRQTATREQAARLAEVLGVTPETIAPATNATEAVSSGADVGRVA